MTLPQVLILYLSNISSALDKLCADYENIILLGDFNVEVKEKNISDFMSTYNLKSLVNKKHVIKTLITRHVLTLSLQTLREVSTKAVYLSSLTFTSLQRQS